MMDVYDLGVFVVLEIVHVTAEISICIITAVLFQAYKIASEC